MLDMSLEVKLLVNGLGGGWVGGWVAGWVGGWVVFDRNKATPRSNLQVRTCKIQAKLDSKLDPSVAKIRTYTNYSPTNSALHCTAVS